MPFGYEYWFVYLPQFQSPSFLLFTHRPDGATQLRDYSSGRMVKCGQPPAAKVYNETVEGRTRFPCEAHRTEDVDYWYQKMIALNRRLRDSHPAPVESPPPIAPGSVRRCPSGRATRGSRRQLQDYVNDHSAPLSRAILKELSFGEEATIRWASPLAAEDYQEYRDEEFLKCLGLVQAPSELAGFWPAGGPCWDALGIIEDPGGASDGTVLLLEAKSHRSEVYGGGCGAENPSSVTRIRDALHETKRFCGADLAADWMGPLYQSGNRLAHLYFLLQRLNRPACLVNLYFIDDPIDPTSLDEWRSHIAQIKRELGLRAPVPNAVDVFLPALSSASQDRAPAPESSRRIHSLQPAAQGVQDAAGFAQWHARWTELGSYQGVDLPDLVHRTQALIAHWKASVPGPWKRGVDPHLLEARYRRGDSTHPRSGEHKIEHEILSEFFPDVAVLGGRLADGINAMPLTTDAGGGRSGNVEADLYLLTREDTKYRLIVAEVKSTDKNAWYATIENLRQVRLMLESDEARRLFHRRNPRLNLPPQLPVTGMVLAPEEYYTGRGQKLQSVRYARDLICTMRDRVGCDVRLAVWDWEGRRIREFDAAS